HALQHGFVAAVAAVAVGVVAADEDRIALAQAVEIGVEAEPHRLERVALLRREAARLLPSRRSRADLRGAHADRVERVVEARPARRRPSPAVAAERARLARPAGDRRLRGEDLLGAHAFEPVVAGVELAHVLEAQPAPLARTVEARGAAAGRAELARPAATRRIAIAPLA